MGMIDRFLGVGTAAQTISNAATGVAGAFRENATRRMELDEAAYGHAITQLSAEFGTERDNWFNHVMDALNRLPRPLLTLGTIGLFVYAMVEPVGFGYRMDGLQQVPEPLWWLLGAIVSFYFGAREAHYFRARQFPQRVETAIVPTSPATEEEIARDAASLDAALDAAMQQALELEAGQSPSTAPLQTADRPVLSDTAASENGPSAQAFANNAALRDWATSLKSGG